MSTKLDAGAFVDAPSAERERVVVELVCRFCTGPCAGGTTAANDVGRASARSSQSRGADEIDPVRPSPVHPGFRSFRKRSRCDTSGSHVSGSPVVRRRPRKVHLSTVRHRLASCVVGAAGSVSSSGGLLGSHGLQAHGSSTRRRSGPSAPGRDVERADLAHRGLHVARIGILVEEDARTGPLPRGRERLRSA